MSIKRVTLLLGAAAVVSSSNIARQIVANTTISSTSVTTTFSTDTGSTSTLYSTDLITITSCAPTITDCPANEHAVITTSFPISEIIYETCLITITSCPAAVVDCPLNAVSTTWTPVATVACPTTTAPPAPPPTPVVPAPAPIAPAVKSQTVTVESKNGGAVATSTPKVGNVSTTAYPSSSVVLASGAGRLAGGCGVAGVFVAFLVLALV